MSDAQAPEQRLASGLENLTKRLIQLEASIKKIGTPADNRQLRATIKKGRDDTKKLETNISQVIKGGKPDDISMQKLKRDFDKVQKRRDDIIKLADQMEKKFLASNLPPEEGDAAGTDFQGVMQNIQANAAPRGKQQIQQQQQVQQVQLDIRPLQVEEDIQLEKNKAIRELVDELSELNQMMHEANDVIHQQDEDIKIIRTNVQSANEQVEQAVQEVKQARKSQKTCVIM